jgi:hypothetical protein
MKYLGHVNTEIVELEVIECDCQFHIGIDGTFIDQVGDVKIKCPSCGAIIDTDKIIGLSETV